LPDFSVIFATSCFFYILVRPVHSDFLHSKSVSLTKENHLPYKYRYPVRTLTGIEYGLFPLQDLSYLPWSF